LTPTKLVTLAVIFDQHEAADGKAIGGSGVFADCLRLQQHEISLR
jgi:hypothetical protein